MSNHQNHEGPAGAQACGSLSGKPLLRIVYNIDTYDTYVRKTSNHQNHEGPAGAQACGSLSGRRARQKREGGGARNRSSARKADIKIAAQQQHQTNLRQQAAQISNRAAAPKEPREQPAGRVVARRSVRRRRSQAVSGPRRPRAGEKSRRRPGSETREKSRR